jgi:uncharacterized protein (TIGR02594 family)
MLRSAIGAVALSLCLLNPAQANPEDGSALSAISVRICDKQFGCRYADRSSPVSTSAQPRTKREARRERANSARIAVAAAAEPRANENSRRWWRPFAAEREQQAIVPRLWQPFASSATESEPERMVPRTRAEQRTARSVTTTSPPEPRQSAIPSLGSLSGLGGGGSLVMEARKYAGMTGAQLGVKHRGAWCGEFLGRVARAAGIRTPDNPNLAPEWREAGQRISGPRQGAIALVGRGRGVGHVGIVTGVNDKGDPIIISGNHNNRVVETAYPRGRVVGYVWPGG